ncbi:SGNH/GDSL hydrolase family protein [Paraconexibacter sp.]|uniref:SGNH/GDSL hydrolase family protein n=1 Tax=Paraconexibacter sp. TaxID=2949640 RepID=UPI0035660399
MRTSLLRTALVAALLTLVPATASAAADRYVALGDSYSSGTGTRTYFDSTCQRSVYSYPYLLSQQRANTSLVFAACSGAKTGDVLSNQVSSLTSTTKIVTITIGGNDAGFSNVIKECAKPEWASICDTKVNEAQNYIRNTLPGQLNNVYTQIKNRSPTAKVVVLGYPRLFMGVDCNAGTYFDSDDMVMLNQTADLLNSTTSGRASAYGFTFKNPTTAFTGHAICSSTEWINGLSNPVGESYHPNRTGHSSGYLPLVRQVTG